MNDRLKEISDYVDEYLNNKETNFEKIKNIANIKKDKINIEYIETCKKQQIGFIEQN